MDIVQEIKRLENEIRKIDREIENLSSETTQGRIKQGHLYLKIKRVNGYIYPVWAVVLFSGKNGKVFSKECGRKLTKKLIRSTFNGRRYQELIALDKKLRALLKRRERIRKGLKAVKMILRGLMRGA